MVIFKSKQKKLEADLKIKSHGKRLYPNESVKYLHVKIDTNLSWQYHFNDFSIKLNKANALLFKMRKYVGLKILRPIYFDIIDSYLSNWFLPGLRIVALFNELWFSKKAVRIINFQPRNSHTSSLLKQNSILKFQDKIWLENILFVTKFLNNLTPSAFSLWFSFSLDQHNYDTSRSTQGNLSKRFYKTKRNGKYSITVSVGELWKKIQKQIKDMLLKDLPSRKIIKIVSNFYLKSYY